MTVQYEMRTCRVCGTDKPLNKYNFVPTGKYLGKLCRDCKNARLRAQRAARRPPPKPIVLPATRRCNACGNEYPLTAEFFSVTRKLATGPSRFFYWCRTCHSAATKYRYHKKMATPEGREKILSAVRANRARWRLDPANVERERQWRRESMARVRADPERLRVYQENQRIDKRLSAERKGQTLAQCAVSLEDDRNGQGYVHASVLADLVYDRIEQERSRNFSSDNGEAGTSLGRMAEIAGTTDRTIRAWRIGERKYARTTVADSLLLGLDVFWWEAYDPERKPSLFTPSEWPDVVWRAARAFEGTESW